MSQPEPQNPRSPAAAAAASSAQDETPAAAAAAAQAEMAQAFQDLAKGEQQAAAMEANLTKLEDKLDALLAQFEATDEATGIEPPRGGHSAAKSPNAKGNR